ncbi:MAG TPA: DciA family protein, partial [Citricoccus sp.]
RGARAARSAAGSAGSGASGRRRPSVPDARDPRMLGDVFGRLVTDRGWSSPVAVGSVLSRWDELVGPDIAQHCRPESFENEVVSVRCDSTAWATQLKLLTPALLQRFEQALGPGIVTSLRVAGPAAPSWRKGPRVVRGRGPRDTYG